MNLKDKVPVMHCAGVEGPSLYINNFRVCGPKPWGGGSVVKEWKDAETGDILRALGNNYLQAVNSHEALVEAIKSLLSSLGAENGCDCGMQESYCSLCQAHAALKKAGA